MTIWDRALLLNTSSLCSALWLFLIGSLSYHVLFYSLHSDLRLLGIQCQIGNPFGFSNYIIEDWTNRFRLCNTSCIVYNILDICVNNQSQKLSNDWITEEGGVLIKCVCVRRHSAVRRCYNERMSEAGCHITAKCTYRGIYYTRAGREQDHASSNKMVDVQDRLTLWQQSPQKMRGDN